VHRKAIGSIAYDFATKTKQCQQQVVQHCLAWSWLLLLAAAGCCCSCCCFGMLELTQHLLPLPLIPLVTSTRVQPASSEDFCILLPYTEQRTAIDSY